MSGTEASTQYLRDVALQAKANFDTDIHKCHQVSSAVANKYHQRELPGTVTERAIGDKHVTHWVILYDSAEICNIEADTGQTIIDPTIQQFSLGNYFSGVVEVGLDKLENLPEIGIYPPDSEEREVWYHRK